MDTPSDIFSSFYKAPVALPFLIITAGFVYTLSVFYWGPGITDDSVNYLYASLTFPEALLKVDDTPFVEWPPLFPVLLSGHKFLSLAPVTFASILHGTVFTGNILLGWIILRKVINTPLILFLAILTLIFSTPLLLVHVFVWSEAVFILFMLTALLMLNKYLNRARDLKYLAVLILLSWLMGLQRKTAVFLLISNFSLILFYGKSSPFLKKTFHGLIYISLASLPLLFYGLRKYRYSREVFTDANLNPSRIGENAFNILDIFTSWFFPDELSLSLRILLLGLTALAILLIIRLSSRIRRPRFKSLEVILFVTAISYFIILTLSLAYVYVEEGIDERIMAPVYIPVMICSFVLADITYRKISLLPVAGDFIYRKLFILLLLLWILYPVSRTIWHIGNWKQSGPGGYNSSHWKQNELPGKLLSLKPQKPVYTNNIYASVYLMNLEKQAVVKFKRLENNNLQDNEYFVLCYNPGYQHISQQACVLPILNDKVLLSESPFGEIWRVSNDQ